MKIGEKIKELRRKNGMTQEKLAEYLCVSYQAVSKWETGVANPDLSLIAPLSKLFLVSADELLGIHDVEPDARYQELKREYSQTYRTEDLARRQEICETAVKEYPGDMRWLCDLAWVVSNRSFEHEEQEAFVAEQEKAIKLFDAVIKNCSDEGIRGNAITGVSQLLSWRGRKDEIRQYIELLPEKKGVTREDVMEYLLEGDESIRFRQKRLIQAFAGTCLDLSLMFDCESESADLGRKLIETILPDGNYIGFHTELFCFKERIAKQEMKNGNKEKVLSLLAEMKRHAEETDRIMFDAPGVYRYTVPWFRLVEEDTRNWLGNQSKRWTERFREILREPAFDPLRNDRRFEELIPDATTDPGDPAQ